MHESGVSYLTVDDVYSLMFIAVAVAIVVWIAVEIAIALIAKFFR